MSSLVATHEKDTMSNKIRCETYSPTEAECIEAISENLNNYYIIAARGDIAITHKMKKVAFNLFQKARKDWKNGLYGMSEDWFIHTQLRGWAPVPPRFVVPFGKHLSSK